MIMMVQDADGLVAQGRSHRVSFKEGSLITISSSLFYIDTSWGRLLGHGTELKKVPLDAHPPEVACVIYIGQHPNGLCLINYPTMGVVWVMPSAIHQSEVIDGSH